MEASKPMTVYIQAGLVTPPWSRFEIYAPSYVDIV